MTSSTINFVTLAGYPLTSALFSKRTLPVAASMTIAPEYGLLATVGNAVAVVLAHKSDKRKSVEISESLVVMATPSIPFAVYCQR
jgi:hypothetical protein